MNILPKVIIALFGVSAVLDIAEKIHNWGIDKKNKKTEKKQLFYRTLSLHYSCILKHFELES